MNWHPKWNKYAFWMYGFWYRHLMRTAHRFNWHHTVTISTDGDTQVWCQWCGLRQTTERTIYSANTLACSIAVTEKNP